MAKEKQKNESETINGTDTSTVMSVENDEKESISQAKKSLSSSNLIKEFEYEQLKKQLPEIYVGDTVKVGVKLQKVTKKEFNHTRVVIARRHGGLNQIITVRRIFQGIGVERSIYAT